MHVTLPTRRPAFAALLAISVVSGPPAFAQAQAVQATPSDWRGCRAQAADSAARLACFDAWARGQEPADPAPPLPQTAAAAPAGLAAAAAESVAMPAPAGTGLLVPASCRSTNQSELSRFWELEQASNCGTFTIRGYRPISLSWIGSDSVNTAPSSSAAGHTAAFRAYENAEMRIQLSVRTKIAQGLLTDDAANGRDSLWFGYSQQSYWQLFNASLSRPFRSTDHEPELTYVYPTDAALPGGWRLRYSGISAVHQSNGQSLPLSRSWNRVVLMTGMERGNQFSLVARVWARLPERHTDDDNPDVSDHIGRAEVAGFWNVGQSDTLGVTLRHSLRNAARGSVRLEWLHRLGGPQTNGDASGLRFHTQLFSGYGDSLLDFNRRRTVLSVGLSLVDF